ncbi:MAG: hypothetical protein A2Z31_07280 [candidate division NC10 bacterium RBG_16_65_8]|nr:MAG: hypothetical protein A2Z31_07280 [candidate division NC10 bacterium RBG_16_65_8]
MEQDKGDKRADQQRQAGVGQRWTDAQPTKTIAFWLCIASVVVTMIVGFAWGGWVTGGTAQKMAETMADDAVIKRLAPICVVQFNLDPGKDQKLVALKGTDSWQRDGYVEKQGWATMPGEKKADRNVAEACANLLMLASK